MSLSTEQLKFRRQGIGASEIAAICGLNPWTKPIDVWLSKLGIAEFIETEASKVGHRMEPVIADWYAEREGVKLAECGETLQHPQLARVMATPDRIVGDGSRLLECKIVGFYVAHHWDNGVPEYVVLQAQQQLHVARAKGYEKAEVCDVAAAIGTDWQVHRIAYDPELCSSMAEIATDWYERHVVGGVQPEPDGSESYRSYIAQKYPKNLEPMLQADESDESLAEIVKDLVKARSLQDRGNLLRAECENALKARIGNHEGLCAKRWKATWKNDKSGGCDWKALALTFEPTSAQIEKHTRPGPRKFRFKETK